jgi:hypothetical protein
VKGSSNLPYHPRHTPKSSLANLHCLNPHWRQLRSVDGHQNGIPWHEVSDVSCLCLQGFGPRKATKNEWVDLDDFDDDEEEAVPVRGSSNMPYHARPAPNSSLTNPPPADPPLAPAPKCQCFYTCKLVTSESANNYGRCPSLPVPTLLSIFQS